MEEEKRNPFSNENLGIKFSYHRIQLLSMMNDKLEDQKGTEGEEI